MLGTSVLVASTCGLLLLNSSNFNLESKSEFLLFFDEMYFANTHTLHFMLCNTSILRSVKQWGHKLVVLLIIATALWLSQNKIILWLA